MKRIWTYSLIITTIVLIDQFTKGAIQSSFYYGESIPIIDGLFNFTYVKNTGAAFGFGANAKLGIRQFLFEIRPMLLVEIKSILDVLLLFARFAMGPVEADHVGFDGFQCVGVGNAIGGQSRQFLELDHGFLGLFVKRTGRLEPRCHERVQVLLELLYTTSFGSFGEGWHFLVPP